MSAGVATTHPLALGLNLNDWVMPADAFSVPITTQDSALTVGVGTAGLQLTHPLAIGILLEAGSLTLTAEATSVPVTMQDATLRASASGSDIGTSYPLILGLTLGTSGTTNFTLTAEATSVPITMQGATLTASYDPAGVQTTFPLALGLLLTEQSYTLTAEAFSVALEFAPSTSSEFSETPSSTYRPGGVTRTAQLASGSRKQMEAELFKQTLPTVKATKPAPTPLEKRIRPVVEEAMSDEEMLLLL